MKPPYSERPVEPLDNIQLLLQRRAELAKNKSKYTLTEADGNLLTTHSTEVHFADGQVIAQERQDINTAYRVKSGKVTIWRNGFQVCQLTKGYFIGDVIFLYEGTHHIIRASMVADGPVVLDQLNIAFVKQLFNIDTVLSVKFLRHLTAKYSFIFAQILADLNHPSVHPPGAPDITSSLLTATISTSDLHSESSQSSLSSESSSSSLSSDSSPSNSAPTTPTSAPSSPFTASVAATIPAIPTTTTTLPGPDFFTPQEKTEKRRSRHLHKISQHIRHRDNVAYKVYPLVHNGGGIQTLHLNSKKLKIVSKSFGFSFKTSIEFSKILSIDKNGENAVTVIYQPRKVVNLFFKNYYDREEFLGLVTSIASVAPPAPATISQGPVTVPHNTEIDYDVVPLCGGYENFYNTIQSKIILQKGDTVFEEGDLYQRVYSLLKGHCNIIQRGKIVGTMEAGDIFGVVTLLHLRPIAVTLVVASETAELNYIPAYRMNALIDTDPVQAQRLYLHAARALERQIAKALGYIPNKRLAEEERLKREGEMVESDTLVKAEEEEGGVPVMQQAITV